MNNMRRFALIVLCIIFPKVLFSSDWKPAGDKLKTRWASEVNPDCPHPEYPRPQIVRNDWINLNGLWKYRIQDKNLECSFFDGEILVPFCIESSLSGVQKKVGKTDALWYERSFSVPGKWRGKRVLLHFGAVDWCAEVWVNGNLVGIHTGGYSPFSFDISAAVDWNRPNTLKVKVTDSHDDSYQPRGKQAENPSSIWYTSVTGIWQTVWMEAVPRTFINGVSPTYDGKVLNVSVDVSEKTPGDEIKVELLMGGVGYSPECPGKSVIAQAVSKDSFISIPVENPQLWSPETPYLYGLRVSLLRKGRLVDRIDSYTALRTVSVKSDPKPDRNTNSFKRIAINGRRTFFFGPLDQGWWPDGLYTAPTEDALKYDLIKAKGWGWNVIRKHMKTEPARWYYWCDVLGLTVWQDMPCMGDRDPRRPRDTRSREVLENTKNVWVRDYATIGGTDCILTEQAKRNFYKEWEEILNSLKFFQCITVWTPFNEAWGQFDTPEVVEFTRKCDSTRLINEASGGNFTFSGDICAPHHYASPAMNFFCSQFVNVLAEYGGLGLPVEGHLWKNNAGFYYGKAFGNGEDALRMYERFVEMIIPMAINGCSAAIYTEISDVEVEINGIMTYDRAVIKFDEDRLRAANRKLVTLF